jgi:Spy/CpxP family protein refolding chaperone
MQAMTRLILAAAAVLVAAVASQAAGHADTPLVRPAAGFSAARQELPDGPGKAELSKICSGCHDLTFTVSTRETEEGWTQIVNDMRSKGADGTEEQFAKIIAYLAANMGKPSEGHVFITATPDRWNLAVVEMVRP